MINKYTMAKEMIKNIDINFSEFVDAAPIAICCIKSDFTIDYVNPTFLRDFSSLRKLEALIGEDFLNLMGKYAIKTLWTENLNKAKKIGGKTVFQSNFSDETGDKKTYLNFIIPFYRHNSDTAEYMLYLIDKSTSRLLEDERDLIFNLSIDMFSIQSMNGEFKILNPSWVEITGWELEDLYGKKLIDFVHKDDYQIVRKIEKDLKRNKIVSSQELKLKCADGSYKWLEWNIIPIEKKGILTSIVRDITEWKLVKNELQESERKYREVVEHASDYIYSTDISGNLTYANNSFLNNINYSKKEIFNLNAWELILPAHGPKVKKALFEQYKNKIISQYLEYPFYNKDGVIVWFGANVALKKENDEIIGFDFIARDISKRKEAEEKLENREILLSKVINNASELIVLIDYNGIIVDYNNTAETTFGLKNSMKHHSRFIDILCNQTARDQVTEVIEEFNKGNSCEDEFQIWCSDYKNDSLFLSVKMVKLKDESSNVLIFLTNLTELKKSEDISSILFDISRAVNISTDLEQVFKLIYEKLNKLIYAKNFAFARYSKAEGKISFPYFIDQNDLVFDIYNVKDSDCLTAEVIRTKKSQLFNHRYEDKKLRGIHKGKYGTFSESWLGVPLLINDEIYGALIIQSYEKDRLFSEFETKIMESIAELVASFIYKNIYKEKLETLNKKLESRVKNRTKQLEETLEELKEENEQRKKIQADLVKTQKYLNISLEKEKELNQLKSRFISMISHEYRTPLTVIMSSTNLLSGYYNKMTYEQKEKHFKNIVSSVNTMTQLLEDVLSLGKSEVGRFSGELKLIDLNQLLLETMDRISIIDKNRHKIILHADCKIDIETDSKVLNHIMNNLVSNACKYSPDGKAIFILLKKANDKVIIKVVDKGIGIPKENMKNIFEPFYRSNNVGNVEGTGLGLAIVKQSVEALHGEISIESKEEIGTTVTIELPISMQTIVENL